MVIGYSVIYISLIIALIICTAAAFRSDRPVGKPTAFFVGSAVVPIFGNFLIVLTRNRLVYLIGYYIFFVGMDLMLFTLVRFTNFYCQGTGKSKAAGNREHKPTVVLFALIADSIQILLNVFTGHAFDVKSLDSTVFPYFQLVPHTGQILHRVVDYIVLFCNILIFLIATVNTPKIKREKYSVILYTMTMVGITHTVYLITKSSYDRTVIGYGLFTLIAFYFAIIYRPLRFLDQMLSNIISGFSDAFFIFDTNGICVWANTEGCRLTGVTDKNYEPIGEKLQTMFRTDPEKEHGTIRRSLERDGIVKFYQLEENIVKGEDGKTNGCYLRIEDVTEEEMSIRDRDERIGQISREAYRDPLTGVGSKAAYDKKMNEINDSIRNGNAEFAIAMFDINDLKKINDKFGHKYGDIYIKGCCGIFCNAFKHSSVFRIGGDEFAAVLEGSDFENRAVLTEKLRSEIKSALEDLGSEPWRRYSAAVGISDYSDGDESYEAAFKRADEAMYREKNEFKKANGSYR